MRCDGARPACSNCIRQNRTCEFPRTGGMAQKLANLERRMEWMTETSMRIVGEENFGFDLLEWVKNEEKKQPLTYHYETMKLLSENTLLSLPQILAQWPLRYNRVGALYMDQISRLAQSNVRLSLEQEKRACHAWYEINEYIPAGSIVLPLLGSEELLDPSLPQEARDLFVAGVTLLSVNTGAETDSGLFKIALSHATIALDACKTVDPSPVHFLAMVFIVLSFSLCGFNPQIKNLTEQAKEIGMRLGLHQSARLDKMKPEIAERLALAWWILYSYNTNIAILTGQDPWSLKGVTTPAPKYISGDLAVISFFTELLKLYQPVRSLYLACYRDMEKDYTDEVQALDAQLELWSSSLPHSLTEMTGEKNPRLFPLLRMHLVYCILKCILWSKLAFMDQNPTASRTCEQLARRIIVLCYENPNFAKKNGLIAFHADIAYSILFMNGVLFPHKRWIYMDINLMERTMEAILKYSFPLIATEFRKAWNLRITILRRALREADLGLSRTQKQERLPSSHRF